MACEFEYVMEGVTCHHGEVEITKKGDVKIRTGIVEIDGIDGDTFVWCETHQVRLFAGGEHFGVTLNDEWEVV